MTTLILAQRRILSVSFAPYWERAADKFLTINKSGFLSASIMAFISISIICYLVALYFTFDLGFKIQERTKEFSYLEAVAVKTELKLQQDLSGLAQNHPDVLKLMERAAALKYLTSENFAASYRMTQP